MKYLKKILLLSILPILIIISSCTSSKTYLTISIKKSDTESISLSLDPSKKSYFTSYKSKNNDKFSPTSPDDLFKEKNGKSFALIDDLHNANPGEVSEGDIKGYSFYFVNNNSNYKDITVSLKLTISKDKGLSDAIRVMTYYTSDGVQNFRVYQKEDKEETTYDSYSMILSRNALKNFKDNKTIFDTNSGNENIVISGNQGSNYVRYTILFWLEEADPDCNEKISAKNIYFNLEASIIS